MMRNGNGWRGMKRGNGTPLSALTSNRAFQQELLTLVANEFTLRRDLLTRSIDPRRKIEDECGYPEGNRLTPQQWQDLYDTDPIAARVVEVLAREAWQVDPGVYETEDEGEVTAFEQAWDGLSQQLRGQESWFQDEEASPIWEYLRRADILSGIGSYGVILLGLNDGLSLDKPAKGLVEYHSAPVAAKPEGTASGAYPAPSVNGVYRLTVNEGQTAGRQLTFLRVFSEAQAVINRFESNPTSPRYRQPVEYSLTLDDLSDVSTSGAGSSTVKVHWSRVVHVADVWHAASGSEVLAIPRMKPVLRPLMCLQKVYGADGETYWRNCVLKLFFSTQPQWEAINRDSLRDDVEKMMNGLQQWMGLEGMDVNTVAPSVTDPSSHVAAFLEAICIKIGCPVRVFKGSERGELASSQDDQAWNDRLRERQRGYMTPRLVVPFVNRLICLGVLPKPTGFSVYWPDLTSQSNQEKAAYAATIVGMLGQYIGGNVNTVMPEPYLFTRLLDWDQEETDAMLADAASQAEAGMGEEEGGAPAGPQEQPAGPDLVEQPGAAQPNEGAQPQAAGQA